MFSPLNPSDAVSLARSFLLKSMSAASQHAVKDQTALLDLFDRVINLPEFQAAVAGLYFTPLTGLQLLAGQDVNSHEGYSQLVIDPEGVGHDEGLQRYCAGVAPASDSQLLDVESALNDRLDENPPGPYVTGDRVYREALELRLSSRAKAKAGSGSGLYNGSHFIHVGTTFEPSGPGASDRRVVVAARTEGPCYFNTLDTTESLSLEAAIAFHERAEAAPLSIEHLPLRSKLRSHLQGRSELLSGEGRCSSLSVATLLVLRHPTQQEYLGMIWCRSQGAVAVGRDKYHIIPGGMFEYDHQFDLESSQFSLVQNICREYAEELFGVGDDLSKIATHGLDDIPAYMRDANYLRMERLLRDRDTDRKVQLLFAGTSVDLMNLRTELCTVLVVNDPEEVRHILVNKKPSFEFRSREHGPVESGKKFLHLVPLELANSQLLARYPVRPLDMTPHGAAAFWLGKRAFCRARALGLIAGPK